MMAGKMAKWIVPFCLFAFLPYSAQAQIEVDDEDDEEEVIEVDDDELVVTDDEGNEEVIEFPEAMTYDLDSLLNQYMAKTYLDEDNCNMRDINPVFSREEYIDRLSRIPVGGRNAFENLVVGCVHHIIIPCSVHVPYRIGPGTDRLRFQRFRRKTVIHLIRNNAQQIIFKGKRDHRPDFSFFSRQYKISRI